MSTNESAIIRPRRSFIFAPGLRPDMFPKALASGADIVCVELEDGIAPKDKEEARKLALGLFKEKQADDGVERIVRINCLREAFGLADVQSVLATDTPPPALMLPKVRNPDEIVWLDDLLTERGHDTRLHVIIETNHGLEAAFEIAHCSSRIDALFFGGVDMAAELRCVNKKEAQLAKALGFCGKGSVHPKQIAALNEVFTPSAEEIAKARRITKTFEEADTGLVVIDGKLIEKPVLRDMYRILAIADRIDNVRS